MGRQQFACSGFHHIAGRVFAAAKTYHQSGNCHTQDCGVWCKLAPVRRNQRAELFWRRGLGFPCGQALQLGMIRHGMAGIPKAQAFPFDHGGLRCGQAVPVHGQQPRVAQEHIQRRSALAGVVCPCSGRI